MDNRGRKPTHDLKCIRYGVTNFVCHTNELGKIMQKHSRRKSCKDHAGRGETLKAVKESAKLTCEMVIDGCERDMERVASRIRVEAKDLRKTAEGLSSHGERTQIREHAEKLEQIANFADSWAEPEREQADGQ